MTEQRKEPSNYWVNVAENILAQWESLDVETKNKLSEAINPAPPEALPGEVEYLARELYGNQHQYDEYVAFKSGYQRGLAANASRIAELEEKLGIAVEALEKVKLRDVGGRPLRSNIAFKALARIQAPVKKQEKEK